MSHSVHPSFPDLRRQLDESRRKEQLATSKDIEAEAILGALRDEMGELMRSANTLKKSAAKQKAFAKQRGKNAKELKEAGIKFEVSSSWLPEGVKDFEAWKAYTGAWTPSRTNRIDDGTEGGELETVSRERAPVVLFFFFHDLSILGGNIANRLGRG